MKKFISLIAALFCMFSCTQTECEYRITIVYTLNGDMRMSDTVIMQMPEGYVPVYILRNDSGETNLTVRGVDGGYMSFQRHVVYQGSLNVNVVSFDYYETREYKVSSIDGHELKHQ
jgi:hypothetical protein